jgi:four helix bundle protein
MAGHRDLVAWQQAMELVRLVYQFTRNFPKDEAYGLTPQLRRAAVSVPSYLAEGYGRNSRKELHQYVGQARGSLCEVETQIEIARDLGYLDAGNARELLGKVARIGRLLTGLRNWSETTRKKSSPLPTTSPSYPRESNDANRRTH